MTDAFTAFEDEPRWLAWREEQRGGKATKVPYSATGHGLGSATDHQTWGTRSQADGRARELLAKGEQKVGIGIALGDIGDNTFLSGVDLDSSIDQNRALAAWAVRVISALQTYAEVSPSGNGLKAFFYIDSALVRPFLDLIGVNRDKWGCKRGIPGLSGTNHGPGIELYCSHRFFTVTRQSWSIDHPRLIRAEWRQLEELAKLIPAPSRSAADGGGDSSRSARAFRAALQLRATSFEQMCKAPLRTKVVLDGMPLLHQSMRHFTMNCFLEWEQTAVDGKLGVTLCLRGIEAPAGRAW